LVILSAYIFSEIDLRSGYIKLGQGVNESLPLKNMDCMSGLWCHLGYN